MSGRWAREVLGAGLSRRAFLKAAGAATLVAAAGTLGCTGPGGAASATAMPEAVATRAPAAPSGKMVVATDADPAKLVDRAIDAYGGLAGIIGKGDTVLVKANYSFARTSDQAASNHPDVLVRILQRCKDAGAGEVYALDNPIESGPLCLQDSGIGPALKAAGFEAVLATRAGDYVDRAVRCGNVDGIKVPKRLLDADVLISAPVIKSHSNTLLTGGMKNLMGLIYSRSAFHAGQLDQCIADLAGVLRPNLVIADAYRVLKTGGPGGGGPGDEVVYPHQLLVGDDAVAVDAYAAGYLDLKPADVAHVALAHQAGLGEIDPTKLNLIRAGP